MAFQLLSAPIRKFIYEQRWKSLRPIQVAAIEKILTTKNHYILASPTASGKTEAAFFPLLSRVDPAGEGVQILYISPLIALINDQFERVQQMCDYLNIPVTRWHSEASRSLKKALIKEPRGVLLITPESMEAFFTNRSYLLHRLFSNLQAIVIDELHSFIGTERGVQLMSLLHRLKVAADIQPRIIGLSATVGDYEVAKVLTGEPEKSRVLLDRSTRLISGHIDCQEELTPELLRRIYEEVKSEKVLIFPNTRGRVEQIAVGLKGIAAELGEHQRYFSHHSAVHRDIREYVELFSRENKHLPFTIACTSTLELGIDIGTVEKIIQIDSTHSVSSMTQRMGRCARKAGQKGEFIAFATDKYSLLHALACWLLYQEGFVEKPQVPKKPFDILFHQLLSISSQHNGWHKEVFEQEVLNNPAFKNIDKKVVTDLLKEMIGEDYLEEVQGQVILGLTGEKTVRNWRFFGVFKDDPLATVRHGDQHVGEMPFSPQIEIGQTILLAAQKWSIVDYDHEKNLILVVPAPKGDKPLFYGSGASVDEKIRIRIWEILNSDEKYPDLLSKEASRQLELKREWFSHFKIRDAVLQRPVHYTSTDLSIYTFTSSRINRSLVQCLIFQNVDTELDESKSKLIIQGKNVDLNAYLHRVPELAKDPDQIIEDALETNSSLHYMTKWMWPLPTYCKIEILKERYYDFPGLLKYLQNVEFVQGVIPVTSTYEKENKSVPEHQSDSSISMIPGGDQ